MSTYINTQTIQHSLWPAFYGNINHVTLDNNTYRTVLSTTPTMQLVAMSLLPKQEIGTEIHPYTTQFIRIEQGEGIAVIEDKPYLLHDDWSIIIPPGTKHNIINTSLTNPLKLYTIYSPPQHPENHVDKIKPLYD
jgi:mannose-6-phosphate isomerase-like protein (cupin superfamily)